MSNIWTLAFLSFVMGFLSYIARLLGITSEWTLIERPSQPEAVGDSGFFEALIGLANWSWAQVGSIIQLMTFQTPLPDVFSLLFLVAGFMVLYLVIVIIRGGAG